MLDHEPGPIAIGGESTGGYFAALTLLHIRDELDSADRIAAAYLVFAAYDLSGTPSNRGARPGDMADILKNGTGYIVRRYLSGAR